MKENKKIDDNKALLRKMENRHSGVSDKDGEVTIRYDKYMIVSIKEKKYALYAEEVREIIGGIPIFYVPFTPPYVRGFINRHGEPYTVLDLTVLFERENLDSRNFLILKKEDDQLALLISDVVEIINLPESDLHRISSAVKEDDYFIGSISPRDQEEIFVLNLPNVLAKLEADISGI
ncbi:MAG: chemotaxis protein CheW [Spirochaetales bacterium]|nr:chemotaxis protein CheW [Spirochaetales bacterium]